MRETLPTGWTQTTLGELAADEPRAITDGPFGSNLARRHYTADGARVIRLQNIRDGFFRDEASFISLDHFETLRAHEARAGDLIVASLGENLPRACLLPALPTPALVKADCIRVRLSPAVHPKWVLYALQRPEAKRWAEEQLHGVGRMRLGLKGIRRIPIPLPPLDEQRRIVAVLEDHLSRLEAANRLLIGASARAEALVRRSQFRLLDTSPLRVRIADTLEMSIGGVWGSSPGVDEVDVDVARVTELRTRGRLDLGTAARRSVSEKQWKSRQLRAGDLLLEKSGGGPNTPVGRVGLLASDVPDRTIFANFMQLLRPDPQRVRPRYLHLALNALHASGGTAHLQTASTNIRNIKASAFVQLEVPCPSLERQDQLVTEFEEVELAVDRLQQDLWAHQGRSRALRRSLLTTAVGGRL